MTDDDVERVARAIAMHRTPAYADDKIWAEDIEWQRRSINPASSFNLARAALSALPERELLREALDALTEIARDDMGGLQAIYEEHEFNPRDHSKDTCVAKMKSWMEDEATWFMNCLRYLRDRARAAADEIRASLTQEKQT